MENVGPFVWDIILVKFDEHVIVGEGLVSMDVFAVVDDAVIALVSCRPYRWS
jgi:hypothetical protein